jgi:hypothetical protein
MRTTIQRFAAAPFVASLFLSACLYPPTQQQPPVERTQVAIQLPYDLALDAVMHVIATHDYRIQANDPTHGVIEAQTAKFSVADADCGVVGTAIGKEATTPTADSSAVYTFHIKPKGPEASTVAIQAVFATPVRVPFHPLSNAECVSRGVQEAKLLKEIEQQVALTHRPAYKAAPAGSAPAP